MLLNHSPVRIGNSQLVDVLCEINSDGCSIHLGLLLVALTLTPHDASWHDDADRSGGVHPITARDVRNARVRALALVLMSEKVDVSLVGWFVGTYQLRFVELADRRRNDPKRRFLCWENTVLVKAKSMREAHRKVVKVGESHTKPYK